MVNLRTLSVMVLLLMVSPGTGDLVAQDSGTGVVGRSGPRAEVTALRNRIQSLSERARRVITEVEASGSRDGDVLRARDRVDAATQVASGAGSIDDSVGLRAIRDELERALLELEQRSGAGLGNRQPPEALLNAARACFQGRYSDALNTIGASSFTDDESRAYADLLSGAARFALFRLSGEKTDELLESAKEDVRSVAKLRPALVPTDKHFSPEFVTFFRENAGG